MKVNMILLSVVMLSAVSTQSHATGRMTCEPVDKANWIEEAALEEKLASAGWTVRRMKVDGGCWEVYDYEADEDSPHTGVVQ